RQISRFTLFGLGTYVAQPRNTNGTLLSGWLRNPAASRTNFIKNLGVGRQITNSVPDQYLGEVGFSYSVPKVRGLFLTGSARMEGVTVRDMIGGFAGFRRPGYELFAVPGIGHSRGKVT